MISDTMFFVFGFVIALMFIINDKLFLKEGQYRGILGIYDSNGELNLMDTFNEKNGLTGNPIYWF
tara:strand:+ start:301 stop:495 length:195 start_codon:yes stop_codon:yes gene_type:complete